MKLSLLYNNSSAMAQRRLTSAVLEQSRVFERLASGVRINRPGDDPAGLSVSSQLNVRARILQRAKLNIADGYSYLTIADGALTQIASLLSRMAELSGQAANGTFGAVQRKTLSKEYEQLDREIRRIVKDISFNGIRPLVGEKAKGATSTVIDTFGDVNNAVISRNERYVAFSANGDLAGTIRITDTVTGESRIFSGSAVGASLIGVTDDGAVYFLDSASPTARQLVSYSFSTGAVTQLSDSQDVDDFTAIAMSADGNTLVFTSETIYANGGRISSSTGVQNGTQRLYSLNLSTGVVTTNATDLSSFITTSNRLVVSADGSQIGFRTASNGTFVVDYSSQDKTFRSVTSANITLTGISSDGDLVFVSAQDVVGNGNAVNQLFRYSSSSRSIGQLTSFVTNMPLASARLSADGTLISFRSSGNVTGENGGGIEQFFQYDLSLNQMDQLTNLTSSVTLSGHAYNFDGTFIYGIQSGNLVKVDLTPAEAQLDLEVGFGGAANILMRIKAVNGVLRGVGSFNLYSKEFARAALDNARSNIESLASLRGVIGAGFSRLASAESLVGSQRVEIMAANARIVDADVAAESARLVASRILLESASAVLTQANSYQSLALSLLTN